MPCLVDTIKTVYEIIPYLGAGILITIRKPHRQALS